MRGLSADLAAVAFVIVLAEFAFRIAGMIRRRRDLKVISAYLAVIGWSVWVVADVLGGHWLLVPLHAFFVVAELWWLWKNRRGKRKRKALAALGEKSRALRDDLVRRAREAARPRPVLRPGLGGAS